MSFEELKTTIQKLKNEGRSMFLSSSFQTHSIPLIHMISRIDKSIPILFLNTGFLFPETLIFRDEIVDLFGIDLIEVKSDYPLIQQKDPEGRFYYTSDPDYCCFLNKVQPMEQYLKKYDVWINGVRADQNANRRNMSTFQNAPHGCQRFHPILDWTGKDVYAYINEFDLPRHPLDDIGYISIGCEPCTRRWDDAESRDGRWFGQNKTECGLHTDLAKA